MIASSSPAPKVTSFSNSSDEHCQNHYTSPVKDGLIPFILMCQYVQRTSHQQENIFLVEKNDSSIKQQFLFLPIAYIFLTCPENFTPISSLKFSVSPVNSNHPSLPPVVDVIHPETK